METVVKAPLSGRINMRIVGFAVIMAMLIGFPAYLFIDEIVNKGVKVRSDGSVEVNLQAMSTFPFDQENGKLEDIPQRWRELDGKRVVLKGEMYAPYAASSDLRKFDLVYSISKCCTQGPPQIQHFVKSTVTNGRTVHFYDQQVQVTGTLHVKVKKNDAGGIESVYTLDVEDVKPM